MRTPSATSRRTVLRWISRAVALIFVALLFVSAWLLIVDRPGLEARYYALGKPWTGKVLGTEVGTPRLDSARQAHVVIRDFGFSIRWAGWWDVTRRGEHRFVLSADDGGYLRIDGGVVVDTAGVFGHKIESGKRFLEPGFHRVELGLFQRDGKGWLHVQWRGPDAAGMKPSELPATDLYAGRPLTLRKALRNALPSWPRPYRQLLGVALLILLALLFRRWLPQLARVKTAVQNRFRTPSSARWRAAMLLALFLVVFFASLSFAGYLRGGDDAAYLNAATFHTKQWFANRYAHVYLLAFFTALTGGDPLVGVRFWWSFMFATTVAALAIAVRSIGPRLQLRTLVAVLFVLMAQTTVIGLIGAAFADYSAMMFITIAVAVYLYGFVAERDRGASRHEWSALALGALTVAAFRSKEVGAVLLLLPALFLFVDGRLNPRRFGRRLAYWAVGVVSALALLMVLDGLIVKDPFFTGGGGGRFAELKQMNFPAGRRPRPGQDWLTTIWRGRGHGSTGSLRFLWLGVFAGALAAGMSRQRKELRWLHLLPIAYLGALVALYVRMPHPFSSRMLIPISPVACLLAALSLRYTGLDKLSWRQLLSPAALIPGGLIAGLICFVMVPYRQGSLAAADLLPVDLLARFGWTPDHFLIGVALPLLVLAAVGVLALGAGRPEVRVTAVALAFLLAFGTGFAVCRRSLEQHHALQAANLMTYPWKVFEKEISEIPAATIGISRDFQTRMGMTGPTRNTIARLALRRQDISVLLVRNYPPDLDLAIASREAWHRWRQEAGQMEPMLTDTTKWDPLGLIVLMRPKEAVAAEDVLRWLQTKAAALPQGPEENAGGHRRFLREIRGDDSLHVHRIPGTPLYAVNFYPGGWSKATRLGGLVIVNSGQESASRSVGLAVQAGAEEYPIRVFVDDGEQVSTLVFQQSEIKQIDLGPVAPGASRLFVVWSDKAWSPGNGDTRRLGVKVLAPRAHSP